MSYCQRSLSHRKKSPLDLLTFEKIYEPFPKFKTDGQRIPNLIKTKPYQRGINEFSGQTSLKNLSKDFPKDFFGKRGEKFFPWID